MENKVKNKTITVFGSSMPKPGDEEYESAYKLGRLLGENGYNVCTGGYQGIMDAVSKGASEFGVEVFGVTVDIFGAVPSKYLTQNIEFNNLFDRINKLIELGDGFIILRGGTGTLVELSIVWEMVNKKLMNSKPICCHGEMWKPIVEEINRRMEFEARNTEIVKHFSSVENCSQYIFEEISQ